jgi:hypothetical protein
MMTKYGLEDKSIILRMLSQPKRLFYDSVFASLSIPRINKNCIVTLIEQLNHLENDPA